MQDANDNQVVVGCGLVRSCALPAHPKPAAFAIATAMKRAFSIKVNTSFHVWLSFQLQFVYAGKESLTVVAEMLGVKSGLGWYMTWQTGWASYDKSFAALFVICLIFTLVTNGLERIKRYLLRWQNGAEK